MQFISANSKIFSSRCLREVRREEVLQESTENVSESIVSPILVENGGLGEPDVMFSGPSHAKSLRVKNSTSESRRASLKEELTSEIKSLLVESQREPWNLLKPKTGESNNEENEIIPEKWFKNFLYSYQIR